MLDGSELVPTIGGDYVLRLIINQGEGDYQSESTITVVDTVN